MTSENRFFKAAATRKRSVAARLYPALFCLTLASPWISAQDDAWRALETLPDIRLLDNAYDDLSWGIPIALITGSDKDLAFYLAKLRTYTSYSNFDGLPQATQFKSTVRTLLLDTPDHRKSYYEAHNLQFDNADYRQAERAITRFYTRLSLSQRKDLVESLVAIYAQLTGGEWQRYAAGIDDLASKFRRRVPPNHKSPSDTSEPDRQTLKRVLGVELGRYFNVPLHYDDPDCTGFTRLQSTAREKRIALDPGHFGGPGVQDSREYRGYREGRATLITAGLTKALLTACAGIPPEHIILTRYTLDTLPGNSEVTFGNNALLHYRSELLARLKPDLAVSLHTDGGPQRISIFVPSESPQYYFYRSRGFQRATPATSIASTTFAKRMIARLESTLHPLSSMPIYASVYRPAKSVLKAGRDTVFQHLFDSGIPAVLIEGFSHAPAGMADLLTAEQHRTSKVWIAGEEYRFNPLLTHYAKGVALGIVDQLTAFEN